MGKRYYCDYCDRSFQDHMHNRKKHLNGVQHHRAKKAWFDNFRDSAAIYHEEQAKKPCRKFLQTGNCGFGPNCRFSHMSEEDFATLKRQIEDERQLSEDPEFFSDGKQLGRGPEGRPHSQRSIQDWLAMRERKRFALRSDGELESKEDIEGNQTENDLPQQLLSIPDLPPSLLPPPPGGWKIKPDNSWG